MNEGCVHGNHDRGFRREGKFSELFRREIGPESRCDVECDASGKLEIHVGRDWRSRKIALGDIFTDRR